MRSIQWLVASACVGGCLSTPVAAGLPAATVSGTYFTYVSGVPDSDMRATTVGRSGSFNSVGTSSSFQTSSGVVGGEAQTDITAFFGPSPGLIANSHVEGTGVVPDTVLAIPGVGLGGHGADSAGRIDYQFEVIGPAGFADLHVDGTIGMSLGGAVARGSANASLAIFEDFGSRRTILGDGMFGSSNPAPGQGVFTLNRAWYDNSGLVHTESTPDDPNNSYHENGTYRVQTNAIYTVHLVAAAAALYDASYAGADGTFTSNAYADPVLSIDTADTGAYQLLFSDGIGNGVAVSAVPEPDASLLMVAGLAAMGGAMRRRRAERR